MRFDSHWPGDAVAGLNFGTDYREDAFFENLGARSWVGVDGRSNHVDPDPIVVVRQDWRDTAINLALAGSAPSTQLSLQRAGVDTKPAPTDFAGWRTWVTSVVSIVAELWSTMLREREIRRIAAAWEMIDDRRLKDIGITRYEIEYGRNARHWS